MGADYQSKIETLWASYESKKAEEAALLAKSNRILQNLVGLPACSSCCLFANLCHLLAKLLAGWLRGGAALLPNSMHQSRCPSACFPKAPPPHPHPHPTPTPLPPVQAELEAAEKEELAEAEYSALASRAAQQQRGLVAFAAVMVARAVAYWQALQRFVQQLVARFTGGSSAAGASA